MKTLKTLNQVYRVWRVYVCLKTSLKNNADLKPLFVKIKIQVIDTSSLKKMFT